MDGFLSSTVVGTGDVPDKITSVVQNEVLNELHESLEQMPESQVFIGGQSKFISRPESCGEEGNDESDRLCPSVDIGSDDSQERFNRENDIEQVMSDAQT